MQQDHMCIVYREHHPSNAVGQGDAHLPQVRRHFAHQRHAQRPAVLDGLDVFTNDFAVACIKLLQPVADWFNASSCLKKAYKQCG